MLGVEPPGGVEPFEVGGVQSRRIEPGPICVAPRLVGALGGVARGVAVIVVFTPAPALLLAQTVKV